MRQHRMVVSAALLLVLAGGSGGAGLEAAGRPVTVEQAAGSRVDVEIDSRPFTSFYFGPNWPKPFLYPLRTPGGVIVTRGHPLERVEGESDDHVWHRGLWWAHGDVQGIDFWREIVPEQRYPLPVGRIVFRSLDGLESGSETGTVAATFDLMAPGDRSIGTLVQRFEFGGTPQYNWIDAEITIAADRGQCLKLGDTEEGTFAIRVAGPLRETQGAVLQNANGLIGSKNIWGKAAAWVDYSGVVQGERVGVAVFDHPGNPKHPTHWHARGYGLLSANPFGEHDFYGDPARDGGVTVPLHEALTFRYRVIIHLGDVQSANLAELFRRFAAEAEVP